MEQKAGESWSKKCSSLHPLMEMCVCMHACVCVCPCVSVCMCVPERVCAVMFTLACTQAFKFSDCVFYVFFVLLFQKHAKCGIISVNTLHKDTQNKTQKQNKKQKNKSKLTMLCFRMRCTTGVNRSTTRLDRGQLLQC